MARRPKSTIPQYKRKRKRSVIGRILSFLIKLVLAFVLISVLWVLAYRFVNPPITATMLGDVFAGRGATRDWMDIEEIDRDMVRAVIAAEDSKFCQHDGFDLQAIETAMQENASGGRIRGGSTISQQTAKNAFLWQGGGWFRKGLEAWFTVLMEATWDKSRIMEVYLNIAETGIGTYGVNAGAQRYFDHDSSAMSRQEAARIAAVLPLPKSRGAVAPSGFTRRYGNTISARIGVVARDGLDACIYRDIAPPEDRAPPPSRAPEQLPGEEYETDQAQQPTLEEAIEQLPAAEEPLTQSQSAEPPPSSPTTPPPSTEAQPPAPALAEEPLSATQEP